MITQVSISKFKQIESERFEFGPFDLLIGRNNSGKSTILQALAVWRFCVDEFHRSNRKGKSGKQVVLPNFTALPVPEFNLLWKDKTDRHYPMEGGQRKQRYVLIKIDVGWRTHNGTSQVFGVELRYGSPQSVYAIPTEGWDHFNKLDASGVLPQVAYVPPFSGLEPNEEWRDDGPIRKQIGKAQPGTVLRNLLFRVIDKEGAEGDWDEIVRVIRRWFSVELQKPKYRKNVDTEIKCEYKEGSERFDVIAGGSGFHQVLTLLAFLYGLRPTTILLDEPDAHLHVNLQREVLDYFRRVSAERGVQFLTATHAEELVRGVDAAQLVWLPGNERVKSQPAAIVALADVSNTEITALLGSPFIVYVEGESDERILRAWASTCDVGDVMERVFFRVMGGGGKGDMMNEAEQHFSGVRQLIPEARRLVLFDYDTADSYHPASDNPSLCEWKRRNIENYLLVPEAWRRAAALHLQTVTDDLFFQPVADVIGEFFSDQNLTLPQGAVWRTVSANIFEVVHGKGILYEQEDSLFQRLRAADPPVLLPRESVAAAMTQAEIHEEVWAFFAKLRSMVLQGEDDPGSS
jgi:predicted ATPase